MFPEEITEEKFHKLGNVCLRSSENQRATSSQDGAKATRCDFVVLVSSLIWVVDKSQ